MKTPLERKRWENMLKRLISLTNSFPICRERGIIQFYLEELKYRFWRLNVGYYCLCTDIDFVEYRPSIAPSGYVDFDNCDICGLIEIKSKLSATLRPRTNLQRTILNKIATKLQKPLWITTFDVDLSQFMVENTQTNQEQLMNETEYKRWLISLSEPFKDV